jgi:Lon-like ATP-dependent protease
VRGEVLPVGGISSKIQAAIKAGFKEVIIPKANLPDIVLPAEELRKIKVIPASSINDVLANAFVKSGNTTKLLSSLKKILHFLPKPSKLAEKSVS